MTCSPDVFSGLSPAWGLARPRVAASTSPDRPVVRGALLVAVEQARERVFFGDL
ncbi:hypothetical protein [Nonomuraea sp. NPDC049784]|uniref:hypothetical protein n=1 Tax=Nonomuraea sp. NPDC049784 TaxID=3154361 RepID=UPI0033E7BEA4